MDMKTNLGSTCKMQNKSIQNIPFGVSSGM